MALLAIGRGEDDCTQSLGIHAPSSWTVQIDPFRPVSR